MKRFCPKQCCLSIILTATSAWSGCACGHVGSTSPNRASTEIDVPGLCWPRPDGEWIWMPRLSSSPHIPVATVYVEPRYPGLLEEWEHPIILAMWRDGTVIWSEDKLRGGPPYLQGFISAEHVQRALTEMNRLGYLREKPMKWVNMGVESNTIVIVIRDRERRVFLQSWHELFEHENPDRVATSTSEVGVDRDDRERVLATQPAEYRVHRQAYTEIRKLLDGMIPARKYPVGDHELRWVWIPE